VDFGDRWLRCSRFGAGGARSQINGPAVRFTATLTHADALRHTEGRLAACFLPSGQRDEFVTNEAGKGYMAVYRCQWAARFRPV
jgi:hypothetical protein